MTRRLISTGSRFEREIGYSRAVVQDTSEGRWVFVSGTTGYDYKTMTLPRDVETQTRNIFATVVETLADAELALEDVYRVVYYVKDRADKDSVAKILGAHLGDVRPAATLVIAELAEPDMLVEIEFSAFRAR